MSAVKIVYEYGLPVVKVNQWRSIKKKFSQELIHDWLFFSTGFPKPKEWLGMSRLLVKHSIFQMPIMMRDLIGKRLQKQHLLKHFPRPFVLVQSCFYPFLLLTQYNVLFLILFLREIDIQTGYTTRTLLCMPIFIRGRYRMNVLAH